MRYARILIIICYGMLCKKVSADSPVTSTIFYNAYMEYDIVAYAEQSGTMDAKIADYLLDENNLIDVKAAVINALGWDYYGNNNTAEFMKYLALRHGIAAESVNYGSLSGPELMCLGYLKIMDDYNAPDDPLQILEMAKEKMGSSFTVQMIYTIVSGQREFDANWCNIWTGTTAVLNNKNLKRDMKTSAIQAIVDYMILYKSSCYYGVAGE